MKHLPLILAFVLFAGCDIVDSVGVDIKGTTPAQLKPAANPIEADVVFSEKVKERFTGKVVKTTDGDTVTVLVDGE